ncbi:MAG: hypothetical protein HY001_04655 [Candidatus Portnoybacteria bacterium]|nr:hypothetical protein [Candidatus Portnoybacteria bacterium]
MKYSTVFVCLAFLTLLIPGFVFAQPKKEFTVKQDFRSSRAIDFDFTSAWYDGLGKRVIVARDYSVAEASSLLFDSYKCDVESLKSQFNLVQLVKNTGCKVTPSGVLVFGFFRDGVSRNWVGQMYLIEGSSRRLISPSDLFVNKRLGKFSIGVRDSDKFFVVYHLRPPQFFEFKTDTWTKQTNEELKNLRVFSDIKIAWSGNAWFFSRGGKDLNYFDGSLAVGAFGQVPNINFSINKLETDLQGNRMLISDGAKAFRVQDNGYKGNGVVESRKIAPKSKNDVIEATLIPNALTSSNAPLQYFVSTNNGKRWFEAAPNQLLSIGEPGQELRWQAVLNSPALNVTPALKTVELRYAVRDVSHSTIRARDRMRVRDLGRVLRYLDTYNADVGRYPIFELSISKERRWDMLKTSIIEAARSQRRSESYRKRIEKSFPLQPKGVQEEFLYDYRSDSFGNSFVLSVTLEQKENRSLQKDLDGFILNVNCDDPVYCIAKGPAALQEEIRGSGEFLIRLEGDYRVYWVRGKTKRWVTSAQVFEKKGFRWENVVTMTKQEFDRYETGSPLR